MLTLVPNSVRTLSDLPINRSACSFWTLLSMQMSRLYLDIVVWPNCLPDPVEKNKPLSVRDLIYSRRYESALPSPASAVLIPKSSVKIAKSGKKIAPILNYAKMSFVFLRQWRFGFSVIRVRISSGYESAKIFWLTFYETARFICVMGYVVLIGCNSSRFSVITRKLVSSGSRDYMSVALTTNPI